MNNKLYSLIMHADPEFWSGDGQCVKFPKQRFLEHTIDEQKNKFQSLDQSAINKLKELPTLFAVEHEQVDTRIGKITDIKVVQNELQVSYEFDTNYYSLSKGVLQKNWRKLNINEPGFEFYRTHWAIKECDISTFYEEYLKSLTGIGHKLKHSDKKVQLIYAFNGSGKTRLSREFKDLIDPRTEEHDDDQRPKFLYYNAFTEDLFYWDNDLENDIEPKLKIHRNTYTKSAFEELGLDRNVIKTFQHYTQPNLMPRFSPDFTEVTFSFERGDDEGADTLKISKGEESSFIWSVFYCLLDQVVSTRNIAEVDERETDQFNDIEYVFIDDPVSSLDENHLIQLAVDVAGLIKKSENENGLKFIVTTHNPLFYNVLFNELKSKTCYILNRLEDGTFDLGEKKGDSNNSFSYHLYLKQTIEQAIASDQIERYHFTLLRNLYEKTSSFLGYPQWSQLLPDDQQLYLNRIIQFTSHNTLSNEAVAEPSYQEKQTVKLLLEHLRDNYNYWQEGAQNG